MGIVEAVIASAVIGAAGSAYSASQAKEAQKDATRAQQKAQRRAEEEARRIAMEKRPDEISATLEIGGTTKVGTQLGSTEDFLIPKQKTLGASGSSGLGFKV